ncbi:MAG: hypothetical protein AAFX86_00655 [Pseudomonadota bacterium]
MKSLLLVFATALIAWVWAPAEAQSAFRQIDSYGAGNCIFSTGQLPKGQETAPGYRQISTLFDEGDDIHVRCYFAQTLADYASLGRVANSLRDKQQYYMRLDWMRPEEISGSTRDYKVDGAFHNFNANTRGWDQQRYDLYAQDDCDFKIRNPREAQQYGAYPNRCLNIGNYIRAMSAEKRFPIDEPAEFCVSVFIELADELQLVQRGGNLVEEPNTFNRRLTRGCFSVNVAP